MVTFASPSSLSVAAASSWDGVAPALQVKVVFCSRLCGDMVRILVNGDWEPDKEEILTLSVLFNNGVIPLSQVTETVTNPSKAGSMDTLQVKTKGAVVPAYKTSVAVDRVTAGVGTE